MLRRRDLSVPLLAWAVVPAVLLPRKGRTQSESFDGERMPYDAFDRLTTTNIRLGNATIRLGFAPSELKLPTADIVSWIEASARAVTTYYGRFPVATLRLLLVPVEAAGVRGGTTWGYRGAAIRLRIGRDSDRPGLKRDWVMVHEMVHLALPDLGNRQAWLSEGLAVYVEPIARVQSGDLSEAEIWAAMMRDMPKGLPQPGDRGLNNTPTWGRRYWGGAMFCLFADVAIRQVTANRLGLQHAMRGVLAAGGNHEVDWPVERILTVADKAVGLDVLTRMYREWSNAPVTPDLATLWRDLGLNQDSKDVIAINDDAPLASIRKGITAKIVP